MSDRDRQGVLPDALAATAASAPRPAPSPVSDALAATAATPGPPSPGSAPDAALATLPVDSAQVAQVPGPASQGPVRRAPDDLAALPEVPREVYRVDGELARGGMGRILRARDRRVGRAVAIKESLAPGGPLAARFEREALITARLQHPAIVPVYEAGRWPDGEAFYTMKLVAGRPLDEVIAGARTFAARAALLPHVIAVCEALAYAHDRGIVHRDLKPGNVLVGDYGETVVVDWGLAKDLADASEAPAPAVGAAASASGASGDASSGALTAYGSAIGTPAYMPPEQARGEPVDARADVYALGALLYHLLAGGMPYVGARRVDDLIAMVLRGPPPALAARAPEVPRELVAIVERAMARAPEARYPSAKELAADLRRFQTGQLVSAHRYTARERLWRWVRRHRGAVATAAVLLAVLAVVAVVSVRSVVRARDVAEARRAAVLEEQGRQELLDGRPARALPYLAEAWRAGRRAPSLALLLGEATRATEAIVGVVTHGEVPVELVAPGPGGALATADASGLVRLWRPDGAAGPTLTGHAGEVHAIAWSPDGAWLATAGDDTTVRLWDAATGAARAVLHDHGHVVEDVRFSDDGARLSSRGHDGARLWAVEPGGAPRALAVVPDAERAGFAPYRGAPAWFTWAPAAYDPDADPAAPGAPVIARRLADGVVAGEWPTAPDAMVVLAPDRPVALIVGLVDAHCLYTLLDLDKGARVETFWPSDSSCAITAVLGAGDALAVHDDRELSRRDPETGDAAGVAWLSDGDPILAAVALTLAGRDALAARVGERVVVIDAATGATMDRLDGHVGGVTALAATADGAGVVTGGDDGRAVTWRPRPWLRARQDGVVAAAPDGRVVHFDGGALWLDGAPPAEVRLAAGGHTLALDVAWDAGRVATLGPDDKLRVWDLATSREVASVSVLATAVAIDPTGTWIATTAGADVRLWRADGAPGPQLAGHDHLVTALAWRPDGGALVTASRDGTVRRWDPATGQGEVLGRADDAAGAVAWSRDGARLAFGLGGGEVHVVDVGGRAPRVLRGHGDTVDALAFADDGARLISGGRDGVARVWDLTSGASIAIEHDAPVVGVALRGDGAVVATVTRPLAAPTIAMIDDDGVSTADAIVASAVRLWDAATGALLLERPGAGAPAFVAADGLALHERDGDRGEAARSVWEIAPERRAPRALAVALAAAPWRLDAGRLVATATSWRRATVTRPGRTYDFSPYPIEGEIPAVDVVLAPVPDSAASPARDAAVALRAAVALAATGAHLDAGRAAAAIDGDALGRADELLALAELTAYRGDAVAALAWARRAVEVGAGEPALAPALRRALARLAVDAAIPVAEAIALARAHPDPVEALAALSDAYEAVGLAAESFTVIEVIDAPAATRAVWRVRQALLALYLERLDEIPPLVADAVGLAGDDATARATIAPHVVELTTDAHVAFGATRDRRYGALATALYPLAVPLAAPAEAPLLQVYQRELAALVADPRPAQGALDKALIRRGLRVRHAAIRACYERALLAEPALEGTLGLTFRIDELGRVEDVVLSPPPGQAGLAAVSACVRDRVRDWRFPRPALTDPTTAHMPLELRRATP